MHGRYVYILIFQKKYFYLLIFFKHIKKIIIVLSFHNIAYNFLEIFCKLSVSYVCTVILVIMYCNII